MLQDWWRDADRFGSMMDITNEVQAMRAFITHERTDPTMEWRIGGQTIGFVLLSSMEGRGLITRFHEDVRLQSDDEKFANVSQFRLAKQFTKSQ